MYTSDPAQRANTHLHQRLGGLPHALALGRGLEPGPSWPRCDFVLVFNNVGGALGLHGSQALFLFYPLFRQPLCDFRFQRLYAGIPAQQGEREGGGRETKVEREQGLRNETKKEAGSRDRGWRRERE
jgi:hypothetical protein